MPRSGLSASFRMTRNPAGSAQATTMTDPASSTARNSSEPTPIRARRYPRLTPMAAGQKSKPITQSSGTAWYA